MVSTLVPDEAAIREHLHFVTRRWAEDFPGALLEIRSIQADTKEVRSALFTAERLEAAVSTAVDDNRNGANVYACINPLRPDLKLGKGRAAADSDVLGACFAYADVDGEKAARAALEHIEELAPSLVVRTGDTPAPRLHLYWEMADASRNMDAWRKLQAAIIYRLGSDPAIKNPSRILKLAGSVSWPGPDKRAKGYVAELVRLDREEGEAVDTDWLARMFPPAPAQVNGTAGPGHERLDLEQALDEIRSGRSWHDLTLRLVGRLVSEGMTDAAIVALLARQITLAGYSVDDTKTDLAIMLRGARAKGFERARREEPPPADAPEHDGPAVSKQPGNILAPWDAGIDDGPVPPRGWLLGGQFCRGFVSSLVGPGAVGKSSVRLLQYLSLATGRQLSGEHVFRRARVLLISLEDGRDELRRRLLAARLRHRIELSELAGWLFLATPETLRVAGASDGGSPEEMDGLAAIENVVMQMGIDLAAIDPFKKAHACEENDNNAIDFVATLLTRVAIRRNIAVDLAHHARKGMATSGDADIGRGAGALKDAVRLGYTLTAMTPEDAISLGVEEAERRALVRLDSAKVNIAPPVTDAVWFRLCGVHLGNGTPDYPAGDHVQTAEPWKPTGVFDGLSMADLNGVLNVIAGGLPKGERYSRRPQDKERWAGTLFTQGLKLDPGRAKAIIAAWLASGLLFEDEYESPSQRKFRKCVMVDESKRPGREIES